MIQFLRGTKSQLEASSIVLPAGQPVFESDTGQLKIGNGSSLIKLLPYVGKSNSSWEQIDTSSFKYVNEPPIVFKVTDRLYFVLNTMLCLTKGTTPKQSNFSGIFDIQIAANGTKEAYALTTKSPLYYYINTDVSDIVFVSENHPSYSSIMFHIIDGVENTNFGLSVWDTILRSGDRYVIGRYLYGANISSSSIEESRFTNIPIDGYLLTQDTIYIQLSYFYEFIP